MVLYIMTALALPAAEMPVLAMAQPEIIRADKILRRPKPDEVEGEGEECVLKGASELCEETDAQIDPPSLQLDSAPPDEVEENTSDGSDDEVARKGRARIILPASKPL
ncbi:hypothetical protein [Sphingomicrobium aestuariivivum]|uniref:hypothetical protein n=1 Tax=Sphingomicrobium aestuariivivum TaxID=1582356 RepID=UPI001FD6EE79|nr:hypothetical protein [Sphingomicrobium aestuariivivum]MCJ8190741.1 hypothetical protein [Sphingomicrobium aestuariivivum]